MIGSFKDKEAERIWNRRSSRRLPQDIQRRALKRLVALSSATALQTLAGTPSYRLELLPGGRAGQHSIRINDQWRICFIWRDGRAYDIEIVDYH